MDVSQFLKSFKKNVAAKAKRTAAASGAAVSADSRETEELDDLIPSDSDKETDTQSGDYVVGGSRADKINGKRYAAHQKTNQDFAALNVFSTNAQRVESAGRVQRQRTVAIRQLREAQRRPKAELVASVRADLLRQREQLVKARDALSAEVRAAPVERVAATMVQVEDLLADTAAPTMTTALLDFLPPPLPTAPAAAASEAPIMVPSESSPAPPATPAAAPTAAPPPVVADVAPLKSAPVEAPAASPAKKKSKFELAVAIARAEEAD